jgi:NAD(P)-dependent dehydrogenase (short-subunit alcohol dehydrogenase family)
VVTGGGGGIGRACAERFIAEGAQVVIADIDPEAGEAAASELGEAAVFIRTDVTDPDQVQAMVDFAVSHFGGLHVMVNNAGVASAMARFLHDDLTDFRRVTDINVLGVLLGSQRAARHMKSNGGGSIINMSSTAGLFGLPQRAPYTAAKWAIRGLTKALAQELGPAGVRVNCICPGSVSGDRMDRVVAAQAAASGASLEAVREELTRAASLRTFIAPQDIANMALFVTSDAGARISGQELVVDGHTETF